LQHLLAAFDIDIGDDDSCSFPGKELRRRPADARTPAGDENPPVTRITLFFSRSGILTSYGSNR
jgi:hypothetical protein